MACGRNSEFAALQEELMARAVLYGAPENVMTSIAYCTCLGDLSVVLRMLEDGLLKEFLITKMTTFILD